MEAIKQGISAEGGLFVPESIPSLQTVQLESLIHADYRQRAAEILQMYLTDYSREDLLQCVDKAYRSDSFSSAGIAPVVSLGSGLHILELWHGPTCAFKDMALQILPHLMTAAIRHTGEKKEIVILAATSGDTGKAALEGFKDVSGTRIMVFYPQQGVSEMQKLQMITQQGHNTCVAAVEGNFDDTQTGVKRIFNDPEMKEILDEHGCRFSSANSINWGRLVPQIVYYISSYLDLAKKGKISLGQAVNYVVPTGNFGNILAGYYAKRMGLPICRLICASNDNKVLTDFIRTGIYDRRREFYKTISPSMDILISSNLERLLYELVDHDDVQVTKLMQELSETGRYQVSGKTLDTLQSFMWSSYATVEGTECAIRDTHRKAGYTMDPHTAVGKRVYDEYRRETGDTTETILVSTASPFKFPGDVLRAISPATGSFSDTQLLEQLAQISGYTIPGPLQGLSEKPVLHKHSCTKSGMKDEVISFIKSGR
jgi:threonine synthase